MVSSTQQTRRIRRRKRATLGKVNKRKRRAHGTPPFPIHPEVTTEETTTQATNS